MTNSRFEDLERRCQRIKRARIAKIVLACAFITVIIFGYMYFTLKVEGMNVTPVVSEAIPLQNTNTTTSMIEKVVQVPQVESSKEVQSESEENSTMMNPKYDTLMLSPNIKNNNNNNKKTPLEEKINLDPPTKGNGMLDFDGKEEKRTAEETKKIINLSVKSVGEEEALLKNFQSSSNFKTAYSLAEFYFNKKEYTKAISWAKDSSKLEPTSDKPWIIYAKSKFYLGDKNEAIRSLEVFLAYTSSKEVKDLLIFYKGQQ